MGVWRAVHLLHSRQCPTSLYLQWSEVLATDPGLFRLQTRVRRPDQPRPDPPSPVPVPVPVSGAGVTPSSLRRERGWGTWSE